MTVSQTSILAYYQLDDIGKRQAEVLTIISEYKAITNLEISKILNLPINSITGRTNELVKKGYVESKGTTLIKYPKKTVRVTLWGVV